MTLAVSTEVVIYRDASPYTRLYSFRSESRAYGRRKRLTIVYAERNELSFVLIGSTIELWKVILPVEESQGSHRVMDVVPPYKGELLTDFAVDNTEDPRLGAFSCNSGVIAARIQREKLEVLWQADMNSSKVCEGGDADAEGNQGVSAECSDEFMGTKYDYFSTLAMNKKIVVLGADSGVLRVFDRNTGAMLLVASLNTSGWFRNSPHRMAMSGDTLAILSLSIEGGARSDREASLFIVKTVDRKTNALSFRWRKVTLRRPEVDTQHFGLHVDARRIVASMEIVRVWSEWKGIRAGPQVKLGAVPLSEGDSAPDDLCSSASADSPRKRFDWLPFTSRALWVDDTRIIVGDYSGILHMWSFEPQDD